MNRCIHCNAEIPKGKVVCSRCKPFAQTVRLAAKVGIVSGPLDERYRQAVDFLWNQYETGKSSVDIHKEFGVSANKLFEHFRRFGKKVRTHGEAQQIAITKFGVNTMVPPKYKSGYHTSWDGKTFWCRSSYEFNFAEFLDSSKIPYEVESKRFRYYDSQLKKERIAVPDFYLPDTKELVEIKSNYTLNRQNMLDKIKTYKEYGYKVKLLVNGEETKL